MREIAPGYDPAFAINIGGGAKSPVLRQIKADALGLDYYTQDREEFGTLGAAIVSGHAVGLFPPTCATPPAALPGRPDGPRQQGPRLREPMLLMSTAISTRWKPCRCCSPV